MHTRRRQRVDGTFSDCNCRIIFRHFPEKIYGVHIACDAATGSIYNDSYMGTVN